MEELLKVHLFGYVKGERIGVFFSLCKTLVTSIRSIRSIVKWIVYIFYNVGKKNGHLVLSFGHFLPLSQ